MPHTTENNTKWFKYDELKFKCTFTPAVVKRILKTNKNWVKDAYVNLKKNEAARHILKQVIDHKKRNKKNQYRRLSWSFIFDKDGKVLENIDYYRLIGVKIIIDQNRAAQASISEGITKDTPPSAKLCQKKRGVIFKSSIQNFFLMR